MDSSRSSFVRTIYSKKWCVSISLPCGVTLPLTVQSMSILSVASKWEASTISWWFSQVGKKFKFWQGPLYHLDLKCIKMTLLHCASYPFFFLVVQLWNCPLSKVRVVFVNRSCHQFTFGRLCVGFLLKAGDLSCCFWSLRRTFEIGSKLQQQQKVT